MEITTLHGTTVKIENCIICKRETPRQFTNLLFMDGAHEIRVCSKCDTA